ncbi:MAG: cytochrome c, partial [Deltaproteobacteria bacterium]|nr:cytochrome c [Deltaproteobacteria bacterium]
QQARDGFSYDTDNYDAPGPKLPSMRSPVAGTVPIDGGDFPVTLLDADMFIRNPRPGDPASIERGKVNFTTFCVPCHGADGLGKGLVGQKFPIVLSLVTDQAKGYSDQYLFAMVRNGRGLMPSYGDRVIIDERWDIVNYLRDLQRAPNRDTPAAPPPVPAAQAAAP